jgi:N utilization substance protein A
VPEISDNIIEIKSVARDPGSRAKIAVYSSDTSIDPVGACVGMRGSRVQAVVTELQGEKIDIVPWSEDQATYVVNSLAPAKISKVIFEEGTNRIQVIIPEDQLSLAIGRKGQNVRLASNLTNFEIDIVDEKDEANKRNEEMKRLSDMFIKYLDVDEVIAHLLATEGFFSIEEIASCDEKKLKAIEGFDENLIKELKDRAKKNLDKKIKDLEVKKNDLNLSKDLEKVKQFSLENLVALGEKNIKTLDDLADLSSDELIDIIGSENIKKSDADKIIMDSRKKWFSEEDKSTNK